MTKGASPDNYSVFVNRLADELKAKKAIKSPAVEAAFRKVPRHLFIDSGKMYFFAQPSKREFVCDHAHPTNDILDLIYRDQPIEIAHRSTSSQPLCMADMLEDLQPRPGMKVLEIGSGSGWNAALLAEIIGDSALVYTIEVDEALANSAGKHLREAGYEKTTVICGDGAKGYAAEAPYDAIIVTAGPTDLSPDWIEQLAEGGSILCPIHIAPSGDPTLHVRNVKKVLKGNFTRLMFFVPFFSDLIPREGLPQTMDLGDALALGEKLADEPDFPLKNAFGDGSDRNPCWSFFFFLSLEMKDEERIVATDNFFPCGLASAAKEQAYFTEDGLRGRIIGGREIQSRFEQIAEQWLELNSPRIEDYRILVTPVGSDSPGLDNGWSMRRTHFEYHVKV